LSRVTISEEVKENGFSGFFYGILLEKGRTLRYERRVRLSAETGAGCSNISAALKQMEELSLEDYYGFGK
jgi:hypothetical protein